MVFNTGPYTDLPDNSILITANMQSETGFPSSHQLKSYVALKSRLKLAALAVLSADAGLLVTVVAVDNFQMKCVSKILFSLQKLIVFNFCAAWRLCRVLCVNHMIRVMLLWPQSSDTHAVLG